MNIERMIFGLILVFCVTEAIALPWEEYRRIHESPCSFPGGKITLKAFEMLPEIERIPRDLKFYNYSFFKDGALIDSGRTICRFNQNYNCFEMLNAVDSLDSVAIMSRMYLKDTIPVKFFSGYTTPVRAGFYKTELTLDEADRPVKYNKINFNGSGSNPVSRKEEITIYHNETGEILDSLSTFFQISSRYCLTNAVSEYSIKCDSTENYMTITASTKVTETLPNTTSTRNFIEIYFYNSDSIFIGKKEVDYTRIDADSNRIVKRLRYCYTFSLSTNNILSESIHNTLDSLNPVLIRTAKHTYDSFNRPILYAYADSATTMTVACSYDSSNRIVTTEKNSLTNGAIDFFQTDIHYIGETSIQTPTPDKQKCLFSCRYRQGMLYVVGAGLSLPLAGELYSSSGRKLLTMQQHTSANSSAAFDLTNTLIAPGIYIFKITNQQIHYFYRFKY